VNKIGIHYMHVWKGHNKIHSFVQQINLKIIPSFGGTEIKIIIDVVLRNKSN
jgi:hypothetical protein